VPRRRIIALLCLFVFALGAWVLKTPAQNAPAQDASNAVQTPLRKPSNHSAPPLRGDFQAIEADSPQGQLQRRLRENRYGVGQKLIVDPGATVDGATETSNLTFIDYVKLRISQDPPGIPISESTAVIVGTSWHNREREMFCK
jgi:hypothetical protein